MFYCETHITGLPWRARNEHGDDAAFLLSSAKINRENRTAKIYFGFTSF
jgi:hypothetical protein